MIRPLEGTWFDVAWKPVVVHFGSYLRLATILLGNHLLVKFNFLIITMDEAAETER
ncbi:hypothetical protein WN48_07665 [Eufriesea mexicana]|nr:hypothetical protein WN48_07665 [Eufriesea mexicana]